MATFQPRPKVQSMLTLLNYRESVVLTMRYQHDMTQAEIGDAIGLSQQHVQRLIEGAFEKVRESGGCVVEFLSGNDV